MHHVQRKNDDDPEKWFLHDVPLLSHERQGPGKPLIQLLVRVIGEEPVDVLAVDCVRRVFLVAGPRMRP
jgi:hypothetical protein